MLKQEREFASVEHLEFQPAGGSSASGPGILEKILSGDPLTGDCTRLLRLDGGAESHDVLVHDFWEEVFILEGSITDKRLGQTFSKGMYACRPPGMKHGPYRVDEGCLMFEVRYRK